jgi:ribosome-associated protein
VSETEDPLSQITPPETEALSKAARLVEAALERGAQMPIVMDVSLVTSFADAFVLLSGRSDRQVRAIAEAIMKQLQDAGDAPLGVEGLDDGRWVLIDCNDVVVHVFEPEMRDLYALERLWSDAPSADLVALGLDPVALAEAGTPLEREVAATRTIGETVP